MEKPNLVHEEIVYSKTYLKITFKWSRNSCKINTNYGMKEYNRYVSRFEGT
jgi:hypothetical protein